jgi:hypothetical protein
MSLQQYNQYPALSQARVVAVTNQSGTYYNGPLNNGVGATFTYATGALTIDSVAVVAGDRVLLQNQTNANENGVYICTVTGQTGVSAVLKRADDMQCIEQIKAGQYISVGAGTAHGGSLYTIIEPLPAHFGIDDFLFNATITTGLGTSAAKAASNNSLSTVASTAGSGFTAGNFTTAADTAGTIQDSGFNVDNILRVASVAISAAEFNGMYAAPKQLIAAPGANKLIVVDRLELIMTFGAAQFASGGVVAAQYDSTVHGAGVLATNSEAAADFTGAAASTTFVFNGNAGNTVGAMPFSTTVNKGLYLSNATGAFTTGDSTFVAKVHYRIVATA